MLHLRLLLPTLLSIIITTTTTTTTASATPTCPPTPLPTRCLPTLITQPSLYTACLTTQCYLFLSEPPFINLPTHLPPAPHTPFPCASPHPYTGLSFTIHSLATPGALCIYAGPHCSFNDLVHFTTTHTAHTFAITGLLIHTPPRLCRHNPSSPIIDDAMVIIGRAPRPRRINHLVRPFSALTWLTFIFVALAILSVACCIAFATRGKPSLVTAVFVAAGNSAAALRLDRATTQAPDRAFLTRYGIAVTLLKLAVAVLFTLLALFYEAAVVNFLFQQNTAELGKRVRALSTPELAQYSVLRDSALEEVWNKTINPDGHLYDPVSEPPPWTRCNTSEQCIQWVAHPDHPVLFDVTFGITGRYLIQQLSSCDELTIFETKDILYQFTGGWLYNDAVPSDYRLRVDRHLIGLRINGTLGRVFDDALDKTACAETVSPQLGPLLVLVPLLICVLPPLLAAVLILACAKHTRKRAPHPHAPPAVSAEPHQPPPHPKTVSPNTSVTVSDLTGDASSQQQINPATIS